jgi:hypothetical protein
LAEHGVEPDALADPAPRRDAWAWPFYLGSALASRGQPLVAERLLPLLESGLVARCTQTDLEAGFSSTSPASHRAMRQQRSASARDVSRIQTCASS